MPGPGRFAPRRGHFVSGWLTLISGRLIACSVDRLWAVAALSPAHAAFGDAIRELRKERGISQEGFALKSGLNRGYFGDVERGERNVSLANILKIADALDVPASEIHVRAEALLGSRRLKRR